MDHRRVRIRFMFVAVLAGVLVSPWACAQGPAARTVLGSYSVLQTTDLNDQVRLRLRLELTNPGDAPLSIQVLGLESVLFASRSESSPSAIALSPRGTETVTQEFTLSRTLYDRWRTDPRHRLTLRIESPSGEARNLVISLRRTPGGKGQ